MKKLWKISFFKMCALTFLLSQTGCHFSLYNLAAGKTANHYEVIKSDIPPAPGKGNITGTVLSETDGKPLANVDVLLCLDAVMKAGCISQIGQTKTDQSGIYWFRNLPPGGYMPAIKESEDSFYVLQEKNYDKHLIESVLFDVEAGQTIQIEAQKITYKPQSPDPLDVKYIYPINSETIQERKPKLTWEANQQADGYDPFLYKVNPAGDIQTEPADEFQIKIELENFDGYPSLKTTNIKPLKELEDGIYCWGVHLVDKQDSLIHHKDRATLSCFVVNGATNPQK